MTTAARVAHARAPGKINVFLKVGAEHEDGEHEVAAAYQAAVRHMFPRLDGNPDYTSIVNERHYQRLQGLARRLEKRRRVP